MQRQVCSSSLIHVLVVNCVAGVAMSTSQETQSVENVKPDVLHKSFQLGTGSVLSKLSLFMVKPQSKSDFASAFTVICKIYICLSSLLEKDASKCYALTPSPDLIQPIQKLHQNFTAELQNLLSGFIRRQVFEC